MRRHRGIGASKRGSGPAPVMRTGCGVFGCEVSSGILPRPLRHAFSMVELMIAIMILGIGLVMVATIFPVGLDMTRETVEESIALAAAETAFETVKLKVPPAHDELINVSRPLPWAPPQTVPLVWFPTPLVLPDDPKLKLFETWFKTPLSANEFGMENDATLVADPEVNLAYTTPFDFTRLPYTDFAYDNSVPPQPLPAFHTVFTNAQDRRDIVQRSRAITERGFWDENLAGTAWARVLCGQNVPVDYRLRAGSSDPLRPVLSVEDAPAPASPNAPARLHLAEHIYPPLRTDDLDIFQDASSSARRAAELRLAQAASERRYSWGVIYKPLAQPRTFSLTVLVLSRGELSAQFAYQQDQRAGSPPLGPYDLNPASGYSGPNDVTESLFLPQPVTDAQRNAAPPADDRQDGLFPRPWLVALGLPPNVSTPSNWKILPHPSDPSKFYSVNRQGQALCTAEVARLIPAGSYVVFADTGQPFRVLSSSYERSELGKAPESQSPARLQLEVPTNYGGVGLDVPVYIWVYPPPIVSRQPVEFGGRSPVIAAFQREVTLP